MNRNKVFLIAVAALAFCSATVLAQTVAQSRIVHTKEKSSVHVPRQEPPAALKKIYSNLGTKTDAYNDASGFGLGGPNANGGGGIPYFYAIPFTPKSDSHVSEVQAAIQYAGSGADQVNLSLYADSDGVPGTLLAGPVTVTNLPDSGTCCVLAIADLPSTALSGGVQYWVVANTPLSGTGSDFSGVWDAEAKPVFPMALYVEGLGWIEIDGNGRLAGEVLGTIP